MFQWVTEICQFTSYLWRHFGEYFEIQKRAYLSHFSTYQKNKSSFDNVSPKHTRLCKHMLKMMILKKIVTSLLDWSRSLKQSQNLVIIFFRRLYLINDRSTENIFDGWLCRLLVGVISGTSLQRIRIVDSILFSYWMYLYKQIALRYWKSNYYSSLWYIFFKYSAMGRGGVEWYLYISWTWEKY